MKLCSNHASRWSKQRFPGHFSAAGLWALLGFLVLVGTTPAFSAAAINSLGAYFTPVVLLS